MNDIDKKYYIYKIDDSDDDFVIFYKSKCLEGLQNLHCFAIQYLKKLKNILTASMS